MPSHLMLHFMHLISLLFSLSTAKTPAATPGGSALWVLALWQLLPSWQLSSLFSAVAASSDAQRLIWPSRRTICSPRPRRPSRTASRVIRNPMGLLLRNGQPSSESWRLEYTLLFAFFKSSLSNRVESLPRGWQIVLKVQSLQLHVPRPHQLRMRLPPSRLLLQIAVLKHEVLPLALAPRLGKVKIEVGALLVLGLDVLRLLVALKPSLGRRRKAMIGVLLRRSVHTLTWNLV